MDQNFDKNNILEQLKKRNYFQRDQFSSLIISHGKLLESADSFKNKNIQLTVEVERLKLELLDIRAQGINGSPPNVKNNEREQALEQKLYKNLEELTELHRKQSDNAQQIINLNNVLQEKDKEIQSRENSIRELESEMTKLKEVNNSLEENLLKATATNQVLTDEQQALHLAFTSLETKFRQIQDDNNDLVTRWMALKSKDADRINAENDSAMKVQQKKMQAELADAAKEQVSVNPSLRDVGSEFSPAVCFAVSIPSKALYQMDAHEGEVNAISWSPSGRIFATGGSDRKLKLWEVVSGKCVSRGTLNGSNAALMSVAFNLEENLIIGSSNDFASRVWSLTDHRLRHTLTGHAGRVLAAKFFGDSNKVVSGSHDRTLKIWDLRSRACIKTIFAGSCCNDLVTSDGALGNNIISGHLDKKIRFWDTRSDTSTNQIMLMGKITSIDLSPDRNSLLSCSRDDSINIIDLRMSKVVNTLSADGFHPSCDWNRAVFSPDGEYVLAGSQDGCLYIWNVRKNSVEKTLREHQHAIIACSWHPSGNGLISCDRQKKVVYWADF